MAKKKTATRSLSVKKSATGDLFKDHPNLVWLLPILFIVFAIIIFTQKSSY